jgi:hypothetical protein
MSEHSQANASQRVALAKLAASFCKRIERRQART